MKKHVKAKHPATRRPTLANSGQSDKEIWEAPSTCPNKTPTTSDAYAPFMV